MKRTAYFAIASIALPLTAGSLSAADHYYVNDHLATTTAVTDAAGEIDAIEADAFGTPVAGATQAARYTGKPYDDDIGAFVFPFRNYRSDEARWMSGDPSGFPDGMNCQNYAPNIFNQLDPLGLAGKNLVYAYFKANGGGISASDDKSLINDIYRNVDWLNKDMQHDDSAFFSKTHYLDDGDTLSFSVISSASSIPSLFSSATDVYIIAHGNTSGSSQQRLLNNIWYDESTVLGWSSKIKEVIGCSVAGGPTSINTALTSLEAKTRSLLKDSRE